MGTALLSDLIEREQVSPLVMALARLAGLPVCLLDGDQSLLAASSDPEDAGARPGTLLESGLHILTLPIEIAGIRRGTLLLGPYGSTGHRRFDPSRASGRSRIPVLSRTRVEVVKARAQTLVQLLASMGLRTLELQRAMEDRRQAEAALKAHEIQYQSLVDQMNEGILAGDTDTRITFVNPRMAELLGYRGDELLGKPFYELMDPELRQGYLDRIKRRRTGVSETYEIVLNRKDGSKACFHISASPLRNEHGEVIGSFAMMSDISERKRVEAALRESELKFRSLFETMQDVYYRGDPDGRLTLISPSGARLLGYDSPDELIGCDLSETLYLHPSERKEFLATLHETGFVRGQEITLKRRDGTPIVISHNSRLSRDLEGAVTGVEGVFFDITERRTVREALRKSEERYRLIVDNVQDIIFTHRPDGIISFASGGIRHLGYSIEDSVGRSIFDFVHPDDAGIAREAYLGILRDLKGCRIELRVRCKDGRYVWMEEHGDPIARDGQLVQVTCVLRDITERKAAEEALRLSEEKYRRIVDNIRDLIYSYAPDGTVTFVSESLKRMGYEFDEIVGQSLFDYMHPEDVESMRRALQKATESGRYDPVECRLRIKDGRYFWFEANSEPVFVDGKLFQINGVARDITERKTAETALRESEEKYRWLVEQLSEGILISDLEGIITFVNPRMAEMLGYTVEEITGWKVSLLLSEEELARGLEWAGQHMQGTGNPCELQMVKKSGEKAELLVSGTPLRNKEGGVVGFFGVCSDITEWKRAEDELKRLSAAIEQASDSIIIADTRGTILYANRASEALTGIALAGLLGSPLDILRNSGQAEAFYEQLWQTVMKGETWSGHLVNMRPDGTKYETMTTMSPVRDNAGSIRYVVTNSRDVTREAELEAQLRHSQRMEAIGVLAGGIAHDFNNILTPVMGYTEMALSRPGLDAKVAAYLKEIASAGQRASELVQQILTFSRQSEQLKQPVQVDAIVKESLKLLRAAIPSTIVIRQRIGGAGIQVLADASQIHQVVMNLCTNAFHAMRETGGVMEVALEAVTLEAPVPALGSSVPPGEYLRFSVRDTGRGIDEETCKKVFLPFFTTKRAGEGTGLGLSIVHGIVVGMGGRISLESRVGEGSIFTVYLPSIPRITGPLRPPAPVSPQGSERLAVVDDEGTICTMLEDALTSFGYRVQVFASARAVLESFQKDARCADLVITDLTMPDLTGVELGRQLWEIRPGIPVILMTGYTEDMDEDSAHEAGFAALLRKPVSLTVVGQIVRSILDKAHG